MEELLSRCRAGILFWMDGWRRRRRRRRKTKNEQEEEEEEWAR